MMKLRADDEPEKPPAGGRRLGNMYTTNQKNKSIGSGLRSTLLRISLPVLTLGGTSSDGACSLGGALGMGWDCRSVRAGVEDEVDDKEEEEDDGEEDGG